MSGQWHIARDGNRLGPYSWDDIVQMYHQKKLFQSDQFWNPKESIWITTSQLFELMMMDEKNYPFDGRFNFLSSDRDCKLLLLISIAVLLFTLAIVVFCIVWKNHTCIAFSRYYSWIELEKFSLISDYFALFSKWCLCIVA